MYLRSTQRKNADGSVVQYLQLAHNERPGEGKNAVAKVIHNFGRAEHVDHAGLERLCRSIARVVGLEVRNPTDEPAAAAGGDVLPENVEQLRTRSYGVVLAVESLWNELGIGRVLTKA